MQLYCEDCQVISRDGKICPLCGGKKLRPVEPDDPVLLMTVGDQEASRISAAFKDADIPCMTRALGAGSYLSIIGGQPRSTERRIFVPYREVGRARDVLVVIGALKDDVEKKPEDKEPEEPMSGGKRTTLKKIVSAAAFFALVWIAVSFADAIAQFFKSLFH